MRPGAPAIFHEIDRPFPFPPERITPLSGLFCRELLSLPDTNLSRQHRAFHPNAQLLHRLPRHPQRSCPIPKINSRHTSTPKPASVRMSEIYHERDGNGAR